MPLDFSSYFTPAGSEAQHDFNFGRPFMGAYPASGPIPRFRRTREEVQKEQDTTGDDPVTNPNGLVRFSIDRSDISGPARDASYLDSKTRADKPLTDDERERFRMLDVSTKFAGRVTFPVWMRKTAAAPAPASAPAPAAPNLDEVFTPERFPGAASAADVNKRFLQVGSIVSGLEARRAHQEAGSETPRTLAQKPELLKQYGLDPYKPSVHERVSSVLGHLDRPGIQVATLLAPMLINPHRHPVMAHLLHGLTMSMLVKRVMDMVGPSKRFFDVRGALQDRAAAQAASAVHPVGVPAAGIPVGKG